MVSERPQTRDVEAWLNEPSPYFRADGTQMTEGEFEEFYEREMALNALASNGRRGVIVHDVVGRPMHVHVCYSPDCHPDFAENHTEANNA